MTRDTSLLLRKLNPHCANALERAAGLCHARLAGEITVEHWLLKLLEAGDGDIALVLRHYEIDVERVWDALLAGIERVPRDLRGKPALSSALATLLDHAWLIASADDEPTIRSAHLLQALADAPHLLRTRDAWPLLSIGAVQVRRLMPTLDSRSVEAIRAQPAAGDASPREAPAADDGRPEPNAALAPRVADSSSDALARFAIDLTAKAQRGAIDPVFGREREIQQLVDVLTRRRKNNPILVGEPGVGKTALVEGLALRVADGDVPAAIRDVRLLTLDLGLLQAGAGVKGEFEQRLKNVIEEVQRSPTPVLLFIDEAHTLIGAGNGAGGSDAANLLKPALARGELRTIAATTWSEYKQYFERDAALERRFQMIKVEEPDDDAACLMLRGLAERYAKHHRVHIRDDALVAAVKLSRRYIPARQLPDKAVDLIDTAAARVRIGLESPPADVQRARARVAALELELAALDADRDAGLDDSGRRDAVQAALAAAAQAFDEVQRRYAQELALVTALLGERDAHAKRMKGGPVSDAHAQRAGDAPANGAIAKRMNGAPVCDAHAQRTSDAIAQRMNDAPATSDAIANDALTAARDALAAAQGKTPLIFAEVDAHAVARVVAEWTGVPVGDLVEDEVNRLLTLEQELGARVVAQDDALAALAESLRTAKAGLKHEHAPLGVYLLVGPSGVGKTETALALADLLFGGDAALATINMTEYQEAHTVSQLKGSPPGYVGYGRGGVLTEAVRQRPYSVVLLDEVEKAHRDVLDLFYQVFDRGAMRDGEGREIDFRNCVILMTSNLGSARIDAEVAQDPDISQSQLFDAIRPQLVEHFQPALLARFQTLVFRPLDVGALAAIVRMKLGKVGERLRAQHGIALDCDEALVGTLAQVCAAGASGARNVDAYLNQRVLPALSRELLSRMRRAADAATMPASIRLSQSGDGHLVIDFVDAGENAPAAATS